jgi:hypothetical protein
MPDADSLRERWPAILDAVAQKRRVAWILLSNATVDTLQDGILTLMFTREGEARGFSGSDYDQDLGRVLEAMLGISPKIRAVSAAQGGRAGAGGGAAGGRAAAGGAAGGGVGGGPGVGAGALSGPGSGGSGTIPAGGAADAPSGAAGFGAAASGSGGSDSGAGRGGSAASGSGRSGSGAGRSGSGSGRSGSGAGGTGAGRGGNAAAGDVPPGVVGGPGRAGADDGAAVEALTGMDLIQRTLGGEVIEEIGDA